MHQMLTQLKLARIREIHQDWLDRAAESQMPYPDFLRGLLQEELLGRSAFRLLSVSQSRLLSGLRGWLQRLLNPVGPCAATTECQADREGQDDP